MIENFYRAHKIMAKTAILHGFLTYFFTFFIDCGHIYVSNKVSWGSSSRPHMRNLVMKPFLLWGPPFLTRDGTKMVQFGPKMAEHSRLFSVSKWSKREQRAQNGQRFCFWIIWEHFGPIWTLDPRPFQTKLFFASKGESRVWRRCFGAENHFLFEMV